MEKNQPYKQDKVFDNILETEEFNVYTKIDDLPLDENPMYLEEGINGICTGGSALFNVFGNKRRIVSNDLVVIFPFQLASVPVIRLMKTTRHTGIRVSVVIMQRSSVAIRK